MACAKFVAYSKASANAKKDLASSVRSALRRADDPQLGREEHYWRNALIKKNTEKSTHAQYVISLLCQRMGLG